MASDDENKPASSSNGPLLATAIAALAVIVAVPGVAITVVAGILAVEYRRVRTSRWMLAALVTLVIAVAVAGLNLARWTAWSTSFVAGTWGSGLLPDPGGATGILHWAATHTDATLLSIIATQAAFGVPVGLFCVGAYSVFRVRSRRLLNVVEGPEYSNIRPVGVLDRRHEQRVRDRIASGHYLQEDR
ncbi:hypothetical protein [Dietzia maris]|uniref:hypothetical protein n=1 Tax=Dietzia maris TaxID=37915 RepID=UPI0037CB3F83